MAIYEFDGYRPVVFDVPGQEDDRHAPATELALDRVALTQGDFEVRDDGSVYVRHQFNTGGDNGPQEPFVI